jgi:hypothetical protein
VLFSHDLISAAIAPDAAAIEQRYCKPLTTVASNGVAIGTICSSGLSDHQRPKQASRTITLDEQASRKVSQDGQGAAWERRDTTLSERCQFDVTI